MKTIRVLIVDDLLPVRQGLKNVLELASRRSPVKLEVAGEAENGEAAIRQARALQPEVILMDLEMPGMDGYEATRRIKAELPETRVIILTIHTGVEEQNKAHSAGADVFMMKGENVQTLMEAINGGESPQLNCHSERSDESR